MSEINYNGQILSITAIAKLEGISSTTLTRKYNETQNIIEAVKLAKEAHARKDERIGQILYKDQMLSIYAIAKLEGISSTTLTRKYNETQNITEAVKLAKEAQVRKDEKIGQILYKDQILTLAAIAKLEGISSTTLTRKYNETQNITEAVRLAKESQTKQQERINQIPYNGEILSLYAISKLEGIGEVTLRAKYAKTHDIYEAIKQSREVNLVANRIDYNGQKLSLSNIAKLEGLTGVILKENYDKTKDIYEAVKITKERQNPKIPYNGQMLTLAAIAKLEEISSTTLGKKYSQTNNIHEAVKLAKEAKARQEEKISQISYNDQILPLTRIAKLEGVATETLKKYYRNSQDIYEAVKLAKEGSKRKYYSDTL